jgi:16S rRNA (cytidine1402-2'-O)-methyltransferase
MNGKMYIVSTPIGNLKDISYRGVEVLSSVNCILAEDTRYTSKLLNHYSIKTQVLSYRDQNHHRVISKIIEMLTYGWNLALVSDSGTPLISDPGFKLVRELREKGFEVISIPGASAAISALSISGIPTDKFCFLGFLPKSDAKQKELLERYGVLDSSLIIYESPNRVRKLLEIVLQTIGDRDVFVANELTKLKEKNWNGKISKVLTEMSESPKGEFVVVISKN